MRQLQKIEELIDFYSSLLIKYLELKITTSKKDETSGLINFIDKLNVQKELLEIKKKEGSECF